MTIAIHLSASPSSLITATDTQETYSSGEKIDSGKIIGAWRANPLGAVNVAGAGDSGYINALSQDIVRQFQSFHGTADQLEARVRRLVRAFYTVHVLPFVGRFQDNNVPDFSLLIAARHQGTGKLWTTERTLVTESTPFDCIGVGKPAADALLNRLYPLHPTLDSVAILAAYVIYRVKSSVEGCGLKTEIRFIHRESPGIVPFDLIEKWEALFRRYDRLEREVFYYGMHFITDLPIPRLPQHSANVPAFTPQVKPLSEIVKEIEEIRAAYAQLPIFEQPTST